MEIKDVCKKLEGGPVAFDFETKGLDPTLPDTSIRCVSFANDAGCYSIDFEGGLPREGRAFLFEWMARQRLVAHNYTYDGLWLASELGWVIPAHFCTFGAFRQLATEQFLGQRWSLKYAMTEVLGWPEVNNLDLKSWLAENKMGMGQMSWAPFDILGRYNALDSAATWQLYKYFLTFKDKFPVWWDYHTVDYANETTLLIEQQLLGLTIDVEQLIRFGAELDEKIEIKLAEFLARPEVAPHIVEFNRQQVAELIAAEPPQFKKGGGVTSRWLKWQEKVETAKQTSFFNTDSPQQLTWLFYSAMKLRVQRTTKKGEPSVDAKAIAQMGRVGGLLLEYRNLRDVRKFVTAVGNVQKNGILHPSIKNPATVTSRLGGGVDE